MIATLLHLKSRTFRCGLDGREGLGDARDVQRLQRNALGAKAASGTAYLRCARRSTPCQVTAVGRLEWLGVAAQRQKRALFALPFDGTARSIVCVDTLVMTERWDASVSSELSIRNAQAALRTLIFPQSLPATM
jgi:hypothetical protein